MNKLELKEISKSQTVIGKLCKDVSRRLSANPLGICSLDIASSFVRLCQTQSCGKCAPCRIGLGQIANLMDDILTSKCSFKTFDLIEKTANSIYNSADCAIGYEAANMVLKGIDIYKHEYTSNKENNNNFGSVPCVCHCPANVDIPGYISLIGSGKYSDAVRLIRKDNPFPSVCAFICEHPCEVHCRRNIIDDAVNIRGLKKYAFENAGYVTAPKCSISTKKNVAVIGGGPGGLTAAYYLRLMGHEVDIYERRQKLGGMLRYGIPVYRLPDSDIDADIDVILSTGIKTHMGVNVGTDITFSQLNVKYDSVLITIGAHSDKKLGINGEYNKGVLSAVELLGNIGEGERPDFKDKNVIVIGGGNVAMDASRSSKRLGAKKVSIVYRRRQNDMTALPEEIEGAIAEGCELITLKAPVRIEADNEGNAIALWVQPQIVGSIDSEGRPKPIKADKSEIKIKADIIIVAIGQSIETQYFSENGIPTKRGSIFANKNCEIGDGIFSGGDCVSGPATVIRAIEAGKVLASNIDKYLGFNHKISVDVDIPVAVANNKPPTGRIVLEEREANKRKYDFEFIEYNMTCEEAHQEASRCLRCDHFGYGAFRGGRIDKW